jgi:hypothetical protein
MERTVTVPTMRDWALKSGLPDRARFCEAVGPGVTYGDNGDF